MFWQDLPTPFFVLAPMDGVTDHVFRRVVEHAAPADVYFTEFANARSFAHPQGRAGTDSRLFVTENEGPIIAQIWGNRPEDFSFMAQELAKTGLYQGIDINLGCPVRDIVKQNACSALIGNEPLVAELIAAAKTGGLPISVKTRLGRSQIITDEWFGFLLQQDLAAITVHGRTAKEMSKPAAHWDEIAKVVVLRDKLGEPTRIIGNGDVRNHAHGIELVKETGVDGIMIGRGIFHDIYAFESTPRTHTARESLALLNYHLDLYEAAQYPGSFQALKKFFKIYINGFSGAHELRNQCMDATSTEEVRSRVTDFTAILAS